MLNIDQKTQQPLTSITKKQLLLSTAMKRTSEWILAQETPSDITVHAAGSSFSLHKFPLASKCGLIKKLLSEPNNQNSSSIEIPDIPGGSEAFELAAMFCYGINFEINTDNIAVLRCASEFLEMTEKVSDGNLLSRTESYLEEVVFTSLSASIAVLHKSEKLLPMAEKLKLVSRLIDAIALLACKSSHESLSSKDWWAEELVVLRIDTFQRVLIAMMARGFKQLAVGPVVMLYAQISLRGLDVFGRGSKKIDPREEHEKRVILETVVSLLPREKNSISVSFLSMLLRSSILLETTVACRLDLERRISLQLGHAVLDDLLIPSFSINGETMLDVETIQRILMNYLEHESEGSRLGYNTDDDYVSPPHDDIERVGRLMESYLSEIGSDPRLEVLKFTSLAELIPEQAKVNEDGMYRAIDIFLKSHPSLNDAERKRICRLMDCRRLSREACAHAAQNDRLPVQTVVQLLYFEQQRIRESSITGSFMGGDSPAPSNKSSSFGPFYHAGADELLQLKRENDNLKLELVKMKIQLKESQKASRTVMASAGKPPLPKKSFMNSVSKKLGRLYPFMRSETDNMSIPEKEKSVKQPKNRRYSIS